MRDQALRLGTKALDELGKIVVVCVHLLGVQPNSLHLLYEFAERAVFS